MFIDLLVSRMTLAVLTIAWYTDVRHNTKWQHFSQIQKKFFLIWIFKNIYCLFIAFICRKWKIVKNNNERCSVFRPIHLETTMLMLMLKGKMRKAVFGETTMILNHSFHVSWQGLHQSYTLLWVTLCHSWHTN